jgi:hypothetical protein
MGHRKVSSIIVLFLLVGICTNSVMGEACLCGQACRHSLGVGVNSSFHMRCCGTNCKSCNIEEGQTLKAANAFTTTGSVKIFDTTHIVSVSVDYPAAIHMLKDFAVFYACRTLPSSPIYLQNLALLR